MRAFSLSIFLSACVAATGFADVEADLLCAYAPSYASSVGGDDNAEVLLANAVVGNNLINVQSGTGARIRIAGFYRSVNDPVNWTTTGGMVGWLANNDSRVADVVAQGAALGADLVTYVCQNSDSGSIAAVAQQPGMYSAHNPSAVWYVIFAHEIGGHNYGCSHADGLLSPKTVMLHNYCGGGANAYFTNPHMWLNGVRLLGDGNNCGQGSLISGGDNAWRVAVSAQGVADRRARVVNGPNLNNVVYRWSFTNAPGTAPAGTIVADQVSSAPAVVRGNGAVFTGSALRIPGGTTGNTAANSISAYIDLPNGIISAQTNITIEIWAAPLSAPSWARVFDFGRTVQGGDGLGAPGEYTGTPGTPAPGSTQASDNIMLTSAIGTDINRQRFEARLNGGTGITLDSSLFTTAGAQYHYAVTFTRGVGDFAATGGRWQWYRNGDAIAFLDVNFPLSDIEDVNNWLGRSMWSGDSNAHADYAEVRISNVALTRGEVVAHYMLGPNYSRTATVTLTNSDALGSSSFNAAGNWSNGAPPSGAETYETLNFSLRTPAASGSFVFSGNSLRISGGSLIYKGTASSATTVNSLTLDGGMMHHAGSGTWTVAGNISVTTNGGTFNGVNGAQNVTASLSGNGALTCLAGPTTLSGANSAFAGRIRVGNGVAGTLIIDSQARLGTAPANFVSDQLSLNRGTLQTTATMALDQPNRGILLDRSGGTFNVAAGTTLTVSSPLSSPATPGNVVAGSITKAGAGTMILNSPGNGFKGTVFVDTGSASANDGAMRIANNQVFSAAQGPIFIRNNNSGSSALQLDGSAGSITLPHAISLAGRNSSVAAIQNLAGNNTIAGGISINVGGANYYIQSDAGQLNLGGTISSAATGTRTFTFLGNGTVNVTGTVANGSATVNLSKQGAGTLILAGANSYSGTTTVSAGTLLVNGSVAAGTLSVANGATLGGTGTIGGPVTVQSGGTLTPGSGIGKLTVNNSLTLLSGSTTRVEINRAALTNDQLQVSGTIAYGGHLVVTNLAGTLQAGDAFQLFQAGAFTGSFNSISLPPLAAGLAWDAGNLAVDGSVAVIAIPSPTLNYTMSAGTLEFSWSGAFKLQFQSVPLGTGLNPMSWQDYPGGGTSPVVVPIDNSEEAVFFRLVAGE